jgi:hypothetical protein
LGCFSGFYINFTMSSKGILPVVETIARNDNDLWALGAKISSQKRKISLVVDLCAAHLQDTNYLKHVKAVSFPPNCSHILKSLDQGTIRWFKHYYCKQFVWETISMNDGKFLHATTLVKMHNVSL